MCSGGTGAERHCASAGALGERSSDPLRRRSNLVGGGAAVSGRRFEPWGGLPWGRSAAGRSGAGPQVRALQIGGRTSLPLALPGSIVVAGDQSSVYRGLEPKRSAALPPCFPFTCGGLSAVARARTVWAGIGQAPSRFLARRVLHGAPAVPWPAGYLCDLRRFLARRILGRSAAAFCPMLLAAPARPPDPAPLLQSTLFGAFRAPEGPVCGPSVCPLRYRSGPFAGRSCARARCARPSFPVQAVTRPHADRQSARASSALA